MPLRLRMADTGRVSLAARRLAGRAVDLGLLVAVLLVWGIPVAGGLLVDPTLATAAGPGGPRGGLTGTEVGVFGLGLSAVLLALQVPFLAGSRTLGLGAVGLELRSDGRRAPLHLSLPGTLLVWSLGVGAVLALPAALHGVVPLEQGFAILGVLAGVVDAGVGVVTGRSILDRALGTAVERRASPEAPPEAAPATGWQPGQRPRSRSETRVDPELVHWRQSLSDDVLSAFLGPDPGPLPQPAPEPEHVEHVAGEAPTRWTEADLALARRLRDRLATAEGSPSLPGSTGGPEVGTPREAGRPEGAGRGRASGLSEPPERG